MSAILSYIIYVFNSIVTLLSVKPFPDMPITIIEFLFTIVVLKYLFRFIFGGTKEFESFSSFQIRDVSRYISNNNRKRQIVNSHKQAVIVPASESEKAEMRSLLEEFK